MPEWLDTLLPWLGGAGLVALGGGVKMLLEWAQHRQAMHVDQAQVAVSDRDATTHEQEVLLNGFRELTAALRLRIDQLEHELERERAEIGRLTLAAAAAAEQEALRLTTYQAETARLRQEITALESRLWRLEHGHE